MATYTSQYADGATNAGALGNLALGDDGTNLQSLLVSTAGRLSVDVNGGTLSVTQGTGAALHAVIDALVPGVAATSLGKAAQTGLYASGDTGVLALAVRNDALATINSTNLNYGALAVDGAGRIWTSDSRIDDTAFAPKTAAISVLGGAAFETAPDMVLDGDAGALRMSRRRELYTRSEVVEKLLKDLNDLVALSSIPLAAQDIKNMLLGLSITTSVVTSTIPASIGNVTLLRPNAGRRAASIVNDTTNVLYVKCGVLATTTSYTVKMPINSYFELPQPPWIGQVDAIGATTVGNYIVTEYA